MAVRKRFPARGKTDIISKKIADRLTIGSKRPARALDVDEYGNLRRGDRKGDGLEHDHIPSFAALKKAMELEKGMPLSRAEKNWLKKHGSSITVPSATHKKGRTWGGKNTQKQIELDATDLKAAAEKDYAALRKGLLEDGYAPADVDAALDKIRKLNNQRLDDLPGQMGF